MMEIFVEEHQPADYQ